MAVKKGTWIGGAALASVAIAAGAWFLAISPQIGEAADLRAQTDEVESQNAVLEKKLIDLEAESAKLPQYRADLEAIRIQVPTTAELSEYLRQIATLAAARGVTVTSVTPGLAQAFVPAVAPTAAPEPTETASTTDDESASSDETAAPTPPAGPYVPDGFAAIPLSVTVLGTYDNTLAFLSDLQTVSPRLFLVSGLTGTAQKEAEASSGRPETAVGDQELLVNGFLFVLPDTLSALLPTPEPTDPSATPTPTPTPALPAPVPGKNPLIPIAGE